MKKMVRRLIFVVVGLLVILSVGWYFFLNSVVRRGAEAIVPVITGSEFKLESVSVSPFSGTGTLRGVRVRNPEGFSTEDALTAQTVSFDVALSSLFSDELVINRLQIENPHMTYELATDGRTNIGEIQRSIERFKGTDKASRPVTIKQFDMTGGQVSLSASALAGRRVTSRIPDVHMTDIGTGGEGSSLGQVAEYVFDSVAQAVRAAIVGVRDDLPAEAKNIADQAQKALEDGGEALRGVIEGIGDLLGN